MNDQDRLCVCPVHNDRDGSPSPIVSYNFEKMELFCDMCSHEHPRGKNMDCRIFVQELFDEILIKTGGDYMEISKRYASRSNELVGTIENMIETKKDEYERMKEKLKEYCKFNGDDYDQLEDDKRCHRYNLYSDKRKIVRYLDGLDREMNFNPISKDALVRIKDLIEDKYNKVIEIQKDEVSDLISKLNSTRIDISKREQEVEQLKYIINGLEKINNNGMNGSSLDRILSNMDPDVFKYCFCKIGLEYKWFSDYVRKREVLNMEDEYIKEAYSKNEQQINSSLKIHGIKEYTVNANNTQEGVGNVTYQIDESVKFFEPVLLRLNARNNLIMRSRYVNAKIIEFKIANVTKKVLFAFGASNKEVYVIALNDDIAVGAVQRMYEQRVMIHVNGRYNNVDFGYYDNILYFFTDRGVYSVSTLGLAVGNYLETISNYDPTLVAHVKYYQRNEFYDDTNGECVKLYANGTEIFHGDKIGYLYIDEDMKALFYSYPNQELRCMSREGDIVTNVVRTIKPFSNTATSLVSIFRRSEESGYGKCSIYDILNGKEIFRTKKRYISTAIIPYDKKPNYHKALFVNDEKFYICKRSFEPKFNIDGYKSILRVYKDIYLIYMSKGLGTAYGWYFMKIMFEDEVENQNEGQME